MRVSAKILGDELAITATNNRDHWWRVWVELPANDNSLRMASGVLSNISHADTNDILKAARMAAEGVLQ